MPPHLHPRSRMTSSLFATTVVVSFFVVALPHILPCPAPRVTYADSAQTGHDGTNANTVVIVEHHEDGTTTTTTRQRRRRKPIAACAAENEDDVSRIEALNEKNTSESKIRRNLGQDGEMTVRTRDRECPVPKPGGVLGELLSYVSSKKSGTETGGQQQKSTTTIISAPRDKSASES